MRVPEEGQSLAHVEGTRRRSCAIMFAKWATRTWSSCPLRSTRSTAPGVIRSPAYFAPTSRFGTPADFMYLVDYLHQRGIGVILDWVPGAFSDRRTRAGLLRRHASYTNMPIRARGSSRNGTRCSLISAAPKCGISCISNALFWLDKYHIDGLRVDAVASMLYLDYAKKPGEWIPNRYGGKENLEAIDFLRALNEQVYAEHPRHHDRSPKNRPRGRWYRNPRGLVGWASVSSGIWAGCTTRWITCRRIRCFAPITTISFCSA